MKFDRRPYKEFPLRSKKMVFYDILLIVSISIFIYAAIINTTLDYLFSDISIIINGVVIDDSPVIIAPIVEEITKLVGYGIIFFYNFNKHFYLEYRTKRGFINDNVMIAFLISVGGFGFFEGMTKNIGFAIPCYLAFISLNTLIHITYSIYPFILGRKYRNYFVCFLPIAMLLHSVHNFILDIFWNNKWVTFTMVTIFLIPLLILERNTVFKIVRRMSPKISKNILLAASMLVYIYIFLCCLLAF